MLFRFTAVLLMSLLSTLASAQSLYRWTAKDGSVHYTDLPPQYEVKRLDVRQAGSGNYVESGRPSFTLSKATKDFPATLYAAPDCQIECKAAREFLAQRGEPFTEVGVTADTAISQYKGAFGATGVFLPAITVGTLQKMKGFEKGAWTHMLDDAGYPPSSAHANAAASRTKPSAPATP